MADFRRYLPLSNREPVDESAVSGDWRAQTSQALLELAQLLEALPADAWTTESLRPSSRAGTLSGAIPASSRLTVAAVVERLAHRVQSSRFELLFPRALVHSEQRTPAELVVALRAAAAAPPRRGIGDLSETILATCDIAYSLGVAVAVASDGVATASDVTADRTTPDRTTPDGPAFDPTAFGAAVLARAAVSAPAIRSILQQRTLAPTDAEWRIGSGPEVRASSAVLLLWVAGRDVRPDFA